MDELIIVIFVSVMFGFAGGILTATLAASRAVAIHRAKRTEMYHMMDQS